MSTGSLRRSIGNLCRQSYQAQLHVRSYSASPSLRTQPRTKLASSIKPAQLGQPSHLSHPHLIKPGEITPGITKEEYVSRRKKLMDSIPEDDAIVVCLAGNIKYVSGEIFYKFRQVSDFWYLTGFQEPDAALILRKSPSSPNGYISTLFTRPKDAYQELWNGPRTGLSSSISLLGMDEAEDIQNFPFYLRSSISSDTVVYTSDPPNQNRSNQSRSRQRSWASYFRNNSKSGSSDTYDGVISKAYDKSPSSIRPLATRVFQLRYIKSPAEQRLMRMAADISGTAHAKTMRFTEPGRSEADLGAHFEYLCALEGSERPAYVPVVASGPNALIIHYTANDQVLEDGEMVLVDAGCELHGYASDITRTWPVSGKFTEPQRDLYQAVLNTLKSCTVLCTENNGISLYDLHRKSCEFLLRELRQTTLSQSLDLKDIDRLYPHFVSHPIGIDLHESSEGRSKNLVSGQVITVEPGVYVPPDNAFSKHFHNIGIRLEDEVLVQEDHCIRLTANAPLEIADVEGTCQGLLGIGPY
ncbi:hypothetical protein FRC03_009244 [Tulasnella sp. 419]|nr:hypothetical protein FRC03_009244 [Tulasnella sp. 419]